MYYAVGNYFLLLWQSGCTLLLARSSHMVNTEVLQQTSHHWKIEEASKAGGVYNGRTIPISTIRFEQVFGHLQLRPKSW